MRFSHRVKAQAGSMRFDSACFCCPFVFNRLRILLNWIRNMRQSSRYTQPSVYRLVVLSNVIQYFKIQFIHLSHYGPFQDRHIATKYKWQLIITVRSQSPVSRVDRRRDVQSARTWKVYSSHNDDCVHQHCAAK